MLNLNLFKQNSAAAPALSEETPEKPSYSEIDIVPRSVIGIKRKLSFHVDQTGIQMGCSTQVGRESKLIDARKLYYPSQQESEQARSTFLSDSIARYVQEYGKRSAEIALSVSGPETAFRVFNMPELSSRSLAAAVKYEAKRQVPFPPSECHFDFRPIGRITSGQRTSLRVALHAATNRAIDDRLFPFRQLGYDVAHIYHTHDVIGQLLRYLPDFRPDQHYTLINVERTRTEISYYHGANLEFYHNCSVGSSFLARRSDPTVFEYFAESLAGEIQNSLDFYTGQYSGLFTTRIYIHGDLAYTDELLELLHNRFGYEFRRFPTETLRIKVADGPERLSELSACLPVVASAVCAVELANLIPQEMMVRTRGRRIERIALLSALSLIAVLLVIWGMASMRASVTEERLSRITTEVNNFEHSSLFDTYNVLQRELTAGNAYLENVKPVPSYVALALKELSNLTPTSVQLMNLNYQVEDPGQNMTIDGTAMSTSLPPEVTLAEYVEALQRSPLFDSVSVLRYTKRNDNGRALLAFSLALRGLQ